MIGFIFAGITLAAAIMATFDRYTRRAILALWVAGVGVGAMYLTVGAEFLAIVQWIVSTLVAISFIFFAVMFGEYNHPAPKNTRQQYVWMALSILLGICFTAVIYLGAKDLPEVSLALNSEGVDLGSLGKMLTQDNLLSLEVLGLTLFLVLLGGGVIARTEGDDT